MNPQPIVGDLGDPGPGILVTKDPGSPTGLPVSYTSQNRRVCAVAGTTLAPTAAGSCTVVAAQPGNTQYAPADPRIGSFPVGKIPQAIDFRPLRDVAFGQPVTLIATASSGLPVSYRTTTPGVCTVADGAVTTMA